MIATAVHPCLCRRWRTGIIYNPFFGAPKACSPGAPKASWVTARSTNGKCYPKPQAFPFERASPRAAVRRSRPLSSRAAEVTKQAALRSRRLSSRAAEVTKQAAVRRSRRLSSRAAEVTKRAAAEVAAVVVAGGGGDEAGGGAEVAAVVVAGGRGDDAGRGAEVAAAVVAGFAFVRAAGGFMACEFGQDRVRRDDRGRGDARVAGLHGTRLVHRDAHRHALRVIAVKLEAYIISPRAVRCGQRARRGAAILAEARLGPCGNRCHMHRRARGAATTEARHVEAGQAETGHAGKRATARKSGATQ